MQGSSSDFVAFQNLILANCENSKNEGFTNFMGAIIQ